MAYKNQKNNSNRATTSNKNPKNVAPETNIIYLIPIIFVIAVLPLIMKLREYKTPLSDYPWFTINNTYYDFFLYYKQMLFTGVFIIIFFFILLKRYFTKKKLPFSPIFVPLSIYAAFAFLSSILSKYRNYSFNGIFEQFESIFVLLGYCLIVYYVYVFVQSERDVKYIINALLMSTVIFGLIGLTQISGNDFFNSQMGWSLISNKLYADYKDEFQFVFGKNRVYLTLYNPNYAGVYISLVLPILFFLTIFTKKIWIKLIYFISFAVLVICLYGSRSTAGFVGIILALLLSIVLLWRYLIKYYFISLPIIMLTIISLFVFNQKYDNYLINQFNKVTNIQKFEPSLTDIQTNDDELVIKYNGNTLRTVFFTDEADYCFFHFLDENNNVVASAFDSLNGPVTIQDGRFPGLVFTPTKNGDTIGFNVLIDDKTWFFTNQIEDHSYYYLNIYGRFDKIITAPSAIFTGYESYASGRGYIWSRTIPLLKDNLVLGSGADTFALVFPQQDYVNLGNYGYGRQFVSKPHSLYLQIGVQTGVLSLIAFLIFYIMYFVSSIRLYIKGKFNDYYSKIGAAILVGTLGYMVSGISNDSCIAVAPVFWVLIGLGIVVNSKVKQALRNEVIKIS